MKDNPKHIGFDYRDERVAEIKAPISGKVFSLCEIQEYGVEVSWGEDLFIVSNIPNDTREEAVKWYVKTTGKIPTYRTAYDKKKKIDYGTFCDKTMGERIVISLEPDFNPTGKPHPDTLLKQMKADHGYAKLSETERQKVTDKVNNMITKMEDIRYYGTLKEKVDGVTCWHIGSNYYKNKPYISFPCDVYNMNYGNSQYCKDSISGDDTRHLKEGLFYKAGQTVVGLFVTTKDNPKYLSFDYREERVAEIKTPISGKVFSLCEIQEYGVEVCWGEDLFIVSSIPNDSREDAIKWYKETTGRIPSYKTPEDIATENAQADSNASSFLSKWDL